MARSILISFLISIFIFSLILEISIFDNNLQERLSEKHSDAEDSVNKNAKILEFIKGKELELNMTESEESHMKDVRELHNIFFWFIIILGLVSLGLVIYYFEFSFLFYLWIPLGLYLLILLFGLLFPETLFTLFHKIFFPQGNYMFSTDSFLITLYPASYFYHFFYAVSVRFIITCGILILAGWRLFYFKK